MNQQRQADMRDFFWGHSVFTVGQVGDFMGVDGESAALAARLRYYVRTGRIRSVARGVYAVVPVGVSAERVRPDPFLVAAALRPDAVFSHHSALQLLGSAHSVWTSCTLYASGERRRLSVGGVEVRVAPHPPALARGHAEQLGTREVEWRGVMLRTTGPERTLVEGFRQPGLAGGVAELVMSAAGFPTLDLALLAAVLERYSIRKLWAAAGWFLESHAASLGISEHDLARFERQRPGSPQYLIRDQRGGSLASRWNLIVPPEVAKGDPDGGES